jgi:hypothetical protein
LAFSKGTAYFVEIFLARANLKFMKRLLLLGLLLVGCWRVPTEVGFATDPRILRGTWTGTLEKQCSSYTLGAVFNGDATRVFFYTSGGGSEFFTATGTKLGTLKPDHRISPFAWAANNTDVVYIRNAPSTGFQRVTLNPSTGLEVSVVTLLSEFAGADAIFTPDLRRSAFFATSAVTGIKRLYWRDLTTGILLKSVVWSGGNTNPVGTVFNPSGTKLTYTIYNATSFRMEVFDFETETTTRVFAENSSSGTPVFVNDDQLYVTNISNQGSRYTISAVGLNLTTQQKSQIVVSEGDYLKNDGQYVFTLQFVGSRMAYVKADVLHIQDLETQAILAQQALETNDLLRYSFGGFVQSGAPSGQWLVSAKQPRCGFRIFDANTKVFAGNIELESPETQTVQFEFTPTYRDSSSYTLTGKLQIGAAPERSIIGLVSLPNYCSLFGGVCEQLSRLTPPPPYLSVYPDAHRIQLEYENGVPTPFEVMLVGRRFDTQKAQLFALDYQYSNSFSSEYVLRANPLTTP